MADFLIFRLDTGSVTRATKLTDMHYRKANNNEIKIVLTSKPLVQYVKDEVWAPVNDCKIKRGQL